MVIMGITGTGTAVRYIPRSIVMGFTNGIAIVIASTEVKDFFGIVLNQPVPGDFLGRMRVLLSHMDALTPAATALGVAVVVLVVIWNRFVPRSAVSRSISSACRHRTMPGRKGAGTFFGLRTMVCGKHETGRKMSQSPACKRLRRRRRSTCAHGVAKR